jgi:FlaA1/EpsC-like NDP-sugar epimerase
MPSGIRCGGEGAKAAEGQGNVGNPSGRTGVWARLASRIARDTSRLKNDLPLAALDVLLIAGTYLVLFLARFEWDPPPRYWDRFWLFLVAALVVTIVANWVLGAYGRTWEHASIDEARSVAVAGLASGVVLILVFAPADPRIPLLVLFTGPVVVVFLEGLVRFQARLFAHRRGEVEGHSGLRVAVVGAGHTGAAAVREMRRSPHTGLVPVAVVDDDPRLRHRTLLGVPIAGEIADLGRVIEEYDAHQVLLAIPSGDAELAQRVADAAEASEVAVRVLPESSDWVRGTPSLRDVRDLRIEDLLDRREVDLDLEPVRRLLEGRRVLITGAGGSIGSEIARQVAAFAPERLVLLDHDETHLHDAMAEIPGQAEAVLADIRSPILVDALFRQHRPEVMFHAAAHKHVPILERFPCEAIGTNVIGTRNVVEAALKVGATHFVCISTDKAADPTSAMGASKWLAEQIVLDAAPEARNYRAVRFGNVIGSRGSVIPTFQRQIAAGGPVTVTDPRMTRWFMSIAESVRLVLYAAAIDTDHRVVALRMGRQVNIYELAQRMCRLCGLRPGRDIEIDVTGMRPGEKLSESLVGPGESLSDDQDGAILGIQVRRLDHDGLGEALLRLSTHAERLQSNDARAGLLKVAAARSDPAAPATEVAPASRG